MKRSSGLTLIEMVVVLGILFVITSITLNAFVSFNKEQALDKTTAKVRIMLEDARNRTLSSINDTQYGVHLASNKAVLFQGSSFNSNDPNNESLTLPTTVTIATATLQGGGMDVLFNRLNGTTNTYGTTSLMIVGKANQVKSIVIYKTGLIDTN